MTLRDSKLTVLLQKPLCFSVTRNLLEGDNRLDTWFFHPRFTTLFEALDSTEVPLLEIGDSRISSKVVDGIHKTPAYTGDGLLFIQVSNIKEGEVDFTGKIKCVVSDWEQEVLSRYSGESDDVLVTKDGTIGIAAVVPEDHPPFSIFVSVAAIRPNTDYILPMYLATILNTRLGQDQVERYTRGAVISHLLLEEIRKIKVPLLPRLIQAEIVKLMQDAYQKRNAKLRESEYLFESINEFILDSLGIRALEPVYKLSYSVWLEDDSQARLDPSFYSPRYLELISSIESSFHDVKSLGEISKVIESGARPKGGVKYIVKGVPSIGGEHISADGSFNFDEVRYIPRSFHEKLGKSWVKPFDILMVKDGATTGKVALVCEDFPYSECNINEHVFRIELERGYNPYYVFSFLFSSLGQEQIRRLTSGAAQKGITREAVQKISIVVTPEIQDTVGSEVIKRIDESRKLKVEAETVVNEAKAEVQRIILKNE